MVCLYVILRFSFLICKLPKWHRLVRVLIFQPRCQTFEILFIHLVLSSAVCESQIGRDENYQKIPSTEFELFVVADDVQKLIKGIIVVEDCSLRCTFELWLFKGKCNFTLYTFLSQISLYCFMVLLFGDQNRNIFIFLSESINAHTFYFFFLFQ